MSDLQLIWVVAGAVIVVLLGRRRLRGALVSPAQPIGLADAPPITREAERAARRIVLIYTALAVAGYVRDTAMFGGLPKHGDWLFAGAVLGGLVSAIRLLVCEYRVRRGRRVSVAATTPKTLATGL